MELNECREIPEIPSGKLLIDNDPKDTAMQHTIDIFFTLPRRQPFEKFYSLVKEGQIV